MSISGVLVHTRPEHIDKVGAALGEIPGVEVHIRTEDGRMVVTVEETPETTGGEAVMAIQRLEGVLSASLVYQNFEQPEGAA